MSQPPQQPGPYGQPAYQGQPGRPNEQAPAGQPPFGAPNQPAQFGQPGTFGQSGPYGQDQFAQQPGGFGGPGGFAEQPGHPQAGYPQAGHPQAGYPQAGHLQAGYPQAGHLQAGYLPPGYRSADDVAPTQRRTGLIVGLVIAVVVAVGAGTAAYLLFFHKSSAEALSPDQVVSGFAQSYTALAHSMSATDLTRAKVYLCDKDQVALQGIYDRERSSGGADSSFSLTTSGPVSTNGNAGTFTLVIKDKGASAQHQQGNLAKQNGKWLVCGTLSGQ